MYHSGISILSFTDTCLFTEANFELV